MQFGSVCSGIEAASVAWSSLGWRAAWFAEIEPFPCAVLAHHYPDVPNLGDMTAIARRVLTGDVTAPDVLCGGTPCQAFSVAGLRQSLADERGNLSLKFVELADAIDHVRTGRGEDECIVFWENVPGVLSTRDNAFGCFLAGLAGEDEPLQPPGGKWSNAGAVYGPARAVAWRTLDAQYFGVAQRRRRVFVVASARKVLDPAQVLFEWDGVRRDTAPSRESRQTAPTIPARSTAGDGLGTDFDCDGGLIAGTLQAGGKAAGSATQQDAESGLLVPMVAACLTRGTGLRYDTDTDTDTMIPVTAHTLRGEGFDASEDGTGRGTPLAVPVAVGADCFNGALTGDVAATMGTRGSSESASGPTVLQPIVYATKLHNTASNQAGKFYENYTASLDANSPPPAIVFDTTQITSAANYSNPKPGDPCHPLATGAHAPCIAFPERLSGTQYASTENLSPSLGALNPTAVAVQASQSGVRINDTIGTLDANYGSRRHNGVMLGMQVRRLTPVECERLQGFPDGYTSIPWRGKPAEQCPDGPRYKALGNSWAIPVVRWIGCRIDAAVRRLRP